jgi:hypothetical protein
VETERSLANLNPEQLEALRMAVTVQVLGEMNRRIAGATDREAEYADLRALWAYGLFDPTDGCISRRFLERLVGQFADNGTAESKGPTPLFAPQPLAVDRIMDLVRQHLRNPLS